MPMVAAGVEQVRIDKADTRSGQGGMANKGEQVILVCRLRLRQGGKAADDQIAVGKRAQGQFGRYEAVLDHVTLKQDKVQLCVGRAQVINPDRAIDEDHQNLRRSGAFA
jgi:hypothetical protein